MSRKDAHALGRAIGLALFLVLQGGWIATLVNASDPTAELLGRDWSAFSVAGEKMLSGRSSEVYPVDFSTWPNPRLPNNLAYLYPPFSLYLTLPLGALPPFLAWALCWIVQLGSFAAALILLHRVVGASRDDLMTPAMLAAGSAVLQAVLVIGQISATLLLCFTAGLWAWRQGRAFWAGLAWACLLVKPNWGIPLLALVALSGYWRVLAGGVAGGTALAVVSLPLGPELWSDWVRTVVSYPDVVQEHMQLWRHFTLYAFWRTITGWSADSLALRGVWLATAAPLVLLGATVWITVRSEMSRPRLVGVVCLVGVAANPYCHFYDGLLLVLPALVWWWCRATYVSPVSWRGIGLILTLLYVWQHLSLWILKENAPTLVGPLVAVWAVLEGMDLLAGARRARAKLEPLQASA